MSDDSTLCHVPPPYSLPRLPPLLPLSLILSLSPTFHVSALLPHRRRPLPVPPLPLPRQTAAAASLQTAAAASLAAAAADSSGLPAAECDEPDSAAAAGRVLASECRDCGGGEARTAADGGGGGGGGAWRTRQWRVEGPTPRRRCLGPAHSAAPPPRRPPEPPQSPPPSPGGPGGPRPGLRACTPAGWRSPEAHGQRSRGAGRDQTGRLVAVQPAASPAL